MYICISSLLAHLDIRGGYDDQLAGDRAQVTLITLILTILLVLLLLIIIIIIIILIMIIMIIMIIIIIIIIIISGRSRALGSHEWFIREMNSKMTSRDNQARTTYK